MDALQQTAFAKIAGVDPPLFNPRTGKEERKHRIRVRCRPLHQVLPGGHMVERVTGIDADGNDTDDPDEGRYNFLINVYTSHLEQMRRLVEDASDDDLYRVELEIENRMARWRKKNPEADEATCPHSREAAFFYVMNRDIKPLIDIEVLDAEPGAEPAPPATTPAPPAAKGRGKR